MLAKEYTGLIILHWFLFWVHPRKLQNRWFVIAVLSTNKELSPSAGHTQELKIKGGPNVEEIVDFVAIVICSNLFSREHPTFLSLTHSHTFSNKPAPRQTARANCSHTCLGKHFLLVWNLNLSFLQARHASLLTGLVISQTWPSESCIFVPRRTLHLVFFSFLVKTHRTPPTASRHGMHLTHMVFLTTIHVK